MEEIEANENKNNLERRFYQSIEKEGFFMFVGNSKLQEQSY